MHGLSLDSVVKRYRKEKEIDSARVAREWEIWQMKCAIDKYPEEALEHLRSWHADKMQQYEL